MKQQLEKREGSLETTAVIAALVISGSSCWVRARGPNVNSSWAAWDHRPPFKRMLIHLKCSQYFQNKLKVVLDSKLLLGPHCQDMFPCLEKGIFRSMVSMRTAHSNNRRYQLLYKENTEIDYFMNLTALLI